MKKNIYLLSALAILVIIFGTVYTVAQQSLRLNANEPQVQLAEDTASLLNQGTAPGDAVSGKVDMAASLAPFVIIYDKNGKVVAGSGYLEGSIPTVPYGVLSHVRYNKISKFSDNRVTWQPTDGVRIASVTVSADKYYVLSGRNLREVESNMDHVFQLSVLGGLGSAVVLTFAHGFRVKRNSAKE